MFSTPSMFSFSCSPKLGTEFHIHRCSLPEDPSKVPKCDESGSPRKQAVQAGRALGVSPSGGLTHCSPLMERLRAKSKAMTMSSV